MPTPCDTWPLDSPMLPPLVLRPPHGPRLVRLLVMVLAVIFHVATAGWSLITNGPEGELAAAAQEMLNNGDWLAFGGTALLHGPLAAWLTWLSFALFGVNEFAAHLPAALGVVASVWFTLRLAERLGTLWQGFVAALLLLASPGMSTLGRVLTPAPLATACVVAAFYFLQCGSEHNVPRRRWYLLAWVSFGFATLAGGWIAGVVPMVAVLLLIAFYPAARLRFRLLLSWEGGVVLAVTTFIMLAAGFPPGSPAGDAPELVVPAWQLLVWQAGLVFPWSLLLLPALWAVLSQWMGRRRPLEWNEAFPLAWLAAGVGIAMANPARTLFSSLFFWPAFAVWGALRLRTMHRKTFLRGCALVAVATCGGLYFTSHLREVLPWLFPEKAAVFGAIPDYFWPSVTPVALTAIMAFGLFVVVAFCAEFSQNRRFAVLALFAAMLPAEFALADIRAKFAPFFSDAQIARCIDLGHGDHPLIFVDASRSDSSSLRFYLGDDSRGALRSCERPLELKSGWKQPVYLVTGRSRLPFWAEILENRFTVVCESGEHLLLAARAENGH